MENNENKAKKQRIIIAALILGMMFCSYHWRDDICIVPSK